MQINFIDSITADDKVFVFRFTKDMQEDKYAISLLTHASLQPFTMTYDQICGRWRMPREVNPTLLIFENALSDYNQ